MVEVLINGSFECLNCFGQGESIVEGRDLVWSR